MDLFVEGLALARTRTLRPLVQGSIEEPSFGGAFDLIGAFDVIEHLDDDLNVLRSVRAMLKPRGVLLLTVPAHQSLWSYFDEVSHHRRRYEPNELCTKLNGTGYRVEFCSLFMAATYPILWFTRRIRSMRHASDPDSTEINRALTLKELRIMGGVNGLLTFLLMPEVSLLRSRIRLPFGSSLIAVATRTE